MQQLITWKPRVLLREESQPSWFIQGSNNFFLYCVLVKDPATQTQHMQYWKLSADKAGLPDLKEEGNVESGEFGWQQRVNKISKKALRVNPHLHPDDLETFIPETAVIMVDDSRNMTQILALQLYAKHDPGLRGRKLHYVSCQVVPQDFVDCLVGKYPNRKKT